VYRDYLLRYHLCSSKATRLCASGLRGPFVALAVFVAATLACVFALDRIVSALCILSDKNPGALRVISCVRAKPVFAFAAAGCGECLHCADIMPRAAQNMGALPKTAQPRLWRVARGTELLLQFLGSSVLAFEA